MRNLIIAFIIVLAGITISTGCSSLKKQEYQQRKREKELAKQVSKREEESREAYIKARERQVKIQTKSTIREMKRNQRKSKRYNANKKEFFVIRWFKSKSHSKSRPQGGTRR